MSKKGTVIGIISVIVVAALVYGLGHMILGSIKNDNSKPKGKVDVVDSSKELEYDTNEDNNIKDEEKDIFEYFKDSKIDDVISYIEQKRQIKVKINDKMITFSKNGQKDIVFTAPDNMTSDGVINVDFIDDNCGIIMNEIGAAVGSSYYEVFVTKDGAKTWIKLDDAKIVGDISKLFMIDAANICLVSTGGAFCTNVIYASKDGGKTFEAILGELSEKTGGIIYPVRISADEKVIMIIYKDNNYISDALMYKLDGNYSVIDSYEIPRE